jgi:glucose-6-phosphate 1-dehydrogenase
MTSNVVIFGISGDLARCKLVPALFTLYYKDLLSEDVRII